MKKFKAYILVALMGLSVSSCKDFLTLLPLNEVVLENFWTNESDVESVLRGAYAALETGDCVTRMSAWGEWRSDNIMYGSENEGGQSSSSSSNDDVRQFINETIKENNTYTTYLCFYKTINYANTVLYYAGDVQKKDPNYHKSELRAHQAQAIAIRSLCYWYMMRAFRDVPYVTRPSIDDRYDFFIGQTPFNQVLDSLIYDLDRVKDWAPIHYSSVLTNNKNTSLITRAAVYAMLADMYLWKGDYDNCITCCKYVTKLKKDEYDELFAEKGASCNITLVDNKYPLINGADADKTCGRAYTEIFGTGNSFESLFELYYGTDRSNPFVSNYYNSSSSKIGTIKAYKSAGAAKELFSNFDTRYYEDIVQDGTNYGIFKYVYSKMNYKLENGKLFCPGSDLPGSRRQQNSAEPNWIIYRYTDVLLMQAEALTMQAKALESDTLNASYKPLLDEAFEIVNAIYNRAIAKDIYPTAESLDPTKYTTPAKMEDLVFDERRRELLFEGKRWFDLVRRYLREDNPKMVYETISGKYKGNTKSIEIKFTNPNGLFLPYHQDEVKINENLKQNPAYTSIKEDIKKAK